MKTFTHNLQATSIKFPGGDGVSGDGGGGDDGGQGGDK